MQVVAASCFNEMQLCKQLRKMCKSLQALSLVVAGRVRHDGCDVKSVDCRDEPWVQAESSSNEAYLPLTSAHILAAVRTQLLSGQGS